MVCLAYVAGSLRVQAVDELLRAATALYVSSQGS